MVRPLSEGVPHDSLRPRSASDRPRRPIRLTFLITDLKVGGVPIHLYRLATRLPADRVRVRVISLGEEGPVGTRLRRAGVPVLACGARSVRDMGALWRLWQLLHCDPPDILHSLLFHANIAARIVGPLAGLSPGRIVCEIQTAERERRWHLVADNLTCRLCRCEMGNSPSVVRHLHRAGHLPKSRLRCQWGVVDVEAIASAEPASRASLHIAPDEPMVIWVGRLDPVKGFEEMLAAFGRACADRSGRLVLVGEGRYRPVVERLICDGGLSGRVLMLGQRSDVPALLKAADLFLFCSRTEGLPNALLEAMAAGLPILATDVAGCRDLIVPGQTGLLVRSGAADELTRALRTLLNDPSEAQRLGDRAQAWVRRHLDVGQLADRWLRFYRTLV